jgi:hypothetical protein
MDSNIENHEYNLRQFISIATRWSLTGIYSTQNQNRPFGMMDYYVVNARKFFEEFRNQLRIEFDNPQNGKGFEIDIKHRFLVGIGNYKDWYSSRKNEIEELFGKSNLYSMMLGVMESTEMEFTKYYPSKPNNDIEDNPHPRIFKDLYSFKLFERLFNDYKTSNSLLADFSFIYRKMKEDGFILVKPEEFKLWVSNEPFCIVLEYGIKTISNCLTQTKIKNYNTSKELTKKSVA